ncbi:hypothetical protein QWZ13_11595 [Reinekea marina]|uniref:hypothetical protein n=1 Tax=Reinekea marina TaxID=1310421 RepID=UPI0025B545DC|nr:hypothetical protein [Reinekea marina]MDN3649559.1 hypothetical protein [Reinekea marina]
MIELLKIIKSGSGGQCTLTRYSSIVPTALDSHTLATVYNVIRKPCYITMLIK